MIEETVTFTKNKESIMIDPEPTLSAALFEPINIGREPHISRPQGTISTQRFHTDIENRDQFHKIALGSTLNLIKSLKGKPQSVAEIKVNITQDIDQGADLTE